MRWIRWATACGVLVVALVSGCNTKKGTATAACHDAEHTDTELGRLNTAQLTEGALVIARPATMTAQAFGVIRPDPSDLVPTAPTPKWSTSYARALDVTFAATVPSAVKAEAETKLSSETLFSADTLQRSSIADIVALIERKGRDQILHQMAADKTGVIYLVQAVNYTWNLHLEAKGANEVKGNVSILRLGDYTLAITYQCHALANAAGAHAPAFIKAAAIGYNDSLKTFFIDSSQPSLAKYDLGPAKSR